MDESGTHPETPVLSVAGFYGDEEQWRAYRSAWTPHADGFHAKKCERLFPQLFAAIETSKVNGILTTIGKKTYEQCATPHLKIAIGIPYLGGLAFVVRDGYLWRGWRQAHRIRTRRRPAGIYDG